MNQTYFGCMINLSAFITRSVYWFFLPISFSPNIILIPWLKSKVDFKPPLFFRTHLAISQKQWAADSTHLLLMILPPHLPVLPSPDHIYGTIVSYLTFFKRTYKLPTYNRSILCAKSYRSEYWNEVPPKSLGPKSAISKMQGAVDRSPKNLFNPFLFWLWMGHRNMCVKRRFSWQ